MNRRTFLRLVSIPALAGLLPRTTLADTMADRRHLLLVELKGGNDGLNTVVPYSDPVYYKLRPDLAIPSKQVLTFSPQLGLHPALRNLLPTWQEGELAVVLGVGYPEPNRSHFRSIEIWETGSDSDQYLNDGWLARLLADHPGSGVADGVVLGRGSNGPLSGPGVRTLVMDDPERFLRKARRLDAHAGDAGNPALQHLLQVEAELQGASTRLAVNLPKSSGDFPRTRLGKSLGNAARLIAGDAPPTVIKVSHGSFDTHANQRSPHDRLLRELADGLAAFRDSMEKSGMWDRVLVMTYSEFGRRARQNASRGTDHGTAAPHFLMGGKVRGGFYGRQPELDALEEQDLVFTTDYRRLYATVAREWWGLSPVDTPYKGLGCIA